MEKLSDKLSEDSGSVGEGQDSASEGKHMALDASLFLNF